MFPQGLATIGATELSVKQEEDEMLVPLFTRAGDVQSGGAVEEKFLLLEGVSNWWWHNVMHDGNGVGEVVQVVMPSDCREALVYLVHKGPIAGHLRVWKTVQRL